MFQKKIYIILAFLVIVIASIMLAFATLNDTNEVYKGTLVKEIRMETVVNVFKKS